MATIPASGVPLAAVPAPLVGTMTRVGERDQLLGAAVELDGASGAAGGRGVSIAELAAHPGQLERLVELQCRRWRSDERSVGAAMLFGGVVWKVVAPTMACYLAEGRVPLLDPTAVTLTFGDDGGSRHLAVRTAAFAALPGDPAADHPDATIVADVDALRRTSRDSIATTLACLIPALAPWARRSERVQWGEVADRIAGALQWAGVRFDREAEAIAEADRILDGTPPMPGRGNWVEVDHAGRRCTFRIRNTCCLAYKTPELDLCSTCPLQRPADRLARWRAAMDR